MDNIWSDDCNSSRTSGGSQQQNPHLPYSASQSVSRKGQLEALESIDEEDFELPAPGIIDGICVNRNPRAIEIKDVIDHRRIGPNRRTFYLARELGGVYYWFRSPRTDRDHQLRKLISDYRRKCEAKVAGRKPRGFKRLRSGKMVGN